MVFTAAVKKQIIFSFPTMQNVILGQRHVEFSGVYLLLPIHYVSNYTTSARHTHVHRMGEKKGKQKEISEKFLHLIKVAVANFSRIWHYQTVSLQVQELWNKAKNLCIWQRGLLFTQHFPCLACRTAISGSTFFFFSNVENTAMCSFMTMRPHWNPKLAHVAFASVEIGWDKNKSDIRTTTSVLIWPIDQTVCLQDCRDV